MSKLENITILIEELEILINIFKKSPNREYSNAYILNRTETVNNNYNKFVDIYETLDSKINAKILLSSKEKYNLRYKEVNDLIKKHSRVNLIQETNIETIVDKMASFDILHTVKLIPEFNGESAQLNNFLSLIEYLHNTLKNDDKPKLVEFILKTKLSEKARKKIANNIKIETLDDLKTSFMKTFKTIRSALLVQSELMNSTQGNNTLTRYIDRIQNLNYELSNLQMTDKGQAEKEVIVMMNEQMAMNVFKKGLKEPMRSMVVSARVETLQSAIDLANEAEATQFSADVYNYKTSSYRMRNDNNRGRYQNNRGHNLGIKYNNYTRDNFNQRKNNNYYHNNNSNTRNTQRGNNQRNNNNFRGNNSVNRGNYARNNNQNNRRSVNHISGNEGAVSENHHSRD